MKKSLYILIFLFSAYAARSQTPLNITLNFAKGDSFLIEYEMHSHTEQLIMGAQQNIETDEKIRLVMQITDVIPQYGYSVSMAYKSYRSTIKSNDMLERYNTDSADVLSAYRFMQLLIDRPIMFQTTNKGKLISFDNSKIMLRNDSVDILDEHALRVANERFGNQIPKSILSFLSCPDKPVVDETWGFSDTLYQYPFRYSGITSSLIEQTENAYQLKFSGKISSDPDELYQTNRIFISYRLNGNTENLGRYDKKTGMFIDAEMIQILSGTAGMKYAQNSDTEYTWPISVNNEIRLTSKKF